MAQEVSRVCRRRWFAGPISRLEAEQRLRWQDTGRFLVRESESAPGEFSVSVRSVNYTTHAWRSQTSLLSEYKHFWEGKFMSLTEADIMFPFNLFPFWEISNCFRALMHQSYLLAASLSVWTNTKVFPGLRTVVTRLVLNNTVQSVMHAWTTHAVAPHSIMCMVSFPSDWVHKQLKASTCL